MSKQWPARAEQLASQPIAKVASPPGLLLLVAAFAAVLRLGIVRRRALHLSFLSCLLSLLHDSRLVAELGRHALSKCRVQASLPLDERAPRNKWSSSLISLVDRSRSEYFSSII